MCRTAIAAPLLALLMWTAARGAEPAPLRVLFLGDKGHHVPADRAAQITPVLAWRGIDVRYTDNPADLNTEKLSEYDALILYANIDEITPDQEKALLAYVENGGGFVPLHCASYCFRNSDACVNLIGAQFLRHGMGEFDTQVVDADHPITRGLTPFRTTDETYVHTHHNEKDRHVLQVRAEGNRQEPWTWIRTQGKGRVFYTAYGHDARTWSNPGFQDLLERGIRWAAGRGEVFDSRPRVAKGLKPLEYEPAPYRIPNYVPSTRHGTQGEPIATMQKPLPAAESLKHMAVPKGFEVRLFASEPDIVKPITMAFDHRGRLWVAESLDYPNEKRPLGEGRDRIKICEDTNGDGVADRFTIFADKLSIPTSLCFARGGVIVAQAPEMLFLKDTDGDDRADVREVLFTGFGTSDTHAGPSNLRWGFDNWIWGIIGYSGFRGEVGGERHEFRQGFFRFKPDGSKLEFLRNTNNNSWGVGFSEDGLVFGSTANANPSVYLPIPNRYYEAVRGWSSTVLPNGAADDHFWAVTDKVRQVDWFGRFTAAAGHALYTARSYPRPYWNQTAFVCEPTGHLTATFTLQRKGSDVVSYNGWNLLASDDEWTSPICAEVGPDGSVWVIDWYSYIVQHNPTPQGFKTGKGNAYETPLRDKAHGRVYRIVYPALRASVQPKLDPDNPRSLVAGLRSDNLLWRLHAQRLIVERNRPDVVRALIAEASNRSVDPIGLNPPVIHALWALKGLGVLDGSNAAVNQAMVLALRHPSAGVRRNAVLTLPRSDMGLSLLLDAESLDDPDAQVQLATLLTLTEMPHSERVVDVLLTFLAHGAADSDPWLRDAATALAAAQDETFLMKIVEMSFPKSPSATVRAITERVTEHWSRGRPAKDPAAKLLVELIGADSQITEAILLGMTAGWPADLKLDLDTVSPRPFAAGGFAGKAGAARGGILMRLWGNLTSPRSRLALIKLGERWGSRELQDAARMMTQSLLTAAAKEDLPDAERITAARQAIELRRSDPATAQAVLDLITPRTAPDLAAGWLDALAGSEAPNLATILTERFPTATPATRPAMIRIFLSRPAWTRDLLDALEAGSIPVGALSADQKQTLTTHPQRAIASRAQQILAQGGGLPDPDRQKVIKELEPKVLRAADAARGKLVFKDQCSKCHMHGGEGAKIGPDLTGMAAHPKEELLVHILDPSRSVEGNFVQYTAVTTEGRIINGLLVSESKTAIELVDSEAKRHTLQRDEVEDLKASNKSIMPEGFEKQISTDDLANLLAFLTQRGKYLPLDLRRVATVVSTEGMFYDKNAAAERLIFDDWSPKTVEGVPFTLVDPEGGRVPNVVLLYSRNGTIPPTMPRSVSLPVNTSARAIHLLSGVSGWGFNGSSVPPTISMIVRVHYADGTTEDHPLKNGVEFADYIRVVDVPGSKLAFRLRNQQIRYLSIVPDRRDVIRSIEFVKGTDDTAPVVMAATVEVLD